ncbi:aldo/keto reductase [Candidatus Nitrosotalea okcheonensis]|uniref:Aldo/keto reductase n=1 Tax=Candidatus Nitrosotalea okcheonensis TaxID=1903276 RepID=A0A2H1FCT3_9ARCH|nr:aldo/keto reductase [Candidatus Nitrosotalea okcheonensis]SMH70459.1 Aldo/keto reductase [Candidatus Nitrosotalea okcheonensis]
MKDRLVLGTANFGSAVPETEALEIIDYALSQGIKAIDTANSYGSEEIVGKALKGRRDNVILSTKVGNPAPMGSGLSRRHMEEAIEDSLRRLQTNYVDVYYAHNWDKMVPLEETLKTFDKMIFEGKILSVGCSNFSAEQLEESLDISKKNHITRFGTIQSVYNLIERGAENVLFPLAKKEGIKIATYSPLAGGILTGKYSEGVREGMRAAQFSGANPREAGFIPKITPENIKMGKKVAKIAQKFSITPSQLAIGWVLSNPLVDSVIIGVRSLEQLKEILYSNTPKEALVLI